jgi:hypothetical protein
MAAAQEEAAAAVALANEARAQARARAESRQLHAEAAEGEPLHSALSVCGRRSLRPWSAAGSWGAPRQQYSSLFGSPCLVVTPPAPFHLTPPKGPTAGLAAEFSVSGLSDGGAADAALLAARLEAHQGELEGLEGELRTANARRADLAQVGGAARRGGQEASRCRLIASARAMCVFAAGTRAQPAAGGALKQGSSPLQAGAAAAAFRFLSGPGFHC